MSLDHLYASASENDKFVGAYIYTYRYSQLACCPILDLQPKACVVFQKGACIHKSWYETLVFCYRFYDADAPLLFGARFEDDMQDVPSCFDYRHTTRYSTRGGGFARLYSLVVSHYLTLHGTRVPRWVSLPTTDCVRGPGGVANLRQGVHNACFVSICGLDAHIPIPVTSFLFTGALSRRAIGVWIE